ncbi:MAG TPA: cbb3-type cytochrome c oxidase subunit I, partial [Isosphaeraceae bacterium]
MNTEHAASGNGDTGAAAHGHAHGHDHGHGHDDHIHPAPTHFLLKYVFSHDHKIIGIQFLFSGLIFFVLGGLLAMAVRWQLAWPWKPIPILSRLIPSFSEHGYAMPPEWYNKLFTMHGTVMIFFVIIPLLTGAFGNFLIPLMIGARDMAFPKLNMFSYWAMPFAFVAIAQAFLAPGGAPEAGWTAYPTLSSSRWSTPGSFDAQTWWLLALLFIGISSLMGSINYITTIIMLRAPGMKMFRMPMTVW